MELTNILITEKLNGIRFQTQMNRYFKQKSLALELKLKVVFIKNN